MWNSSPSAPILICKLHLGGTLRHHLTQLDKRICELHAQMMNTAATLAERNRIEAEIRATELAISYYRKALELEGHVGA